MRFLGRCSSKFGGKKATAPFEACGMSSEYVIKGGFELASCICNMNETSEHHLIEWRWLDLGHQFREDGNKR